MPVRSLSHSLTCLLPMVLLLVLVGCMGRWQLGDLGELLHSQAEPQLRSECVNSGPAPCSEQSPDAGMLAPGTLR